MSGGFMNADLKPIVEQLKNKLSEANVEQIKHQVVQGVQIGRQIFEAKAKDLFKQSKNSKIVHEYLIPIVESDHTSKAIELMNDKLKLKDTPLMTSLLKLRQELIDSKVEKAKVAIEIVEEHEPTETSHENQQ